MIMTPRSVYASVGKRAAAGRAGYADRKSTRLNSSHRCISYAVFCLKKKKPPTSFDESRRRGGHPTQLDGSHAPLMVQAKRRHHALSADPPQAAARGQTLRPHAAAVE